METTEEQIREIVKDEITRRIPEIIKKVERDLTAQIRLVLVKEFRLGILFPHLF